MIRSILRMLLAAFTVVACVATVSIPARARSPHPKRTATARTLRGGGKWLGNARPHSAVQRWDIDVTRADDDSFEGRVILFGSPLAQIGRLRGAIKGRRVTGSVTDTSGNHVATFVGTITSNGLQGTYQDRAGEVGRWSWDGQLPR